MILKNSYRPTMMRTNSPFRGPTEINKYSNFILESVHDMKLLGAMMERNDYIQGHKGQADFIYDNFAAYISGDAPVRANMATAGVIRHPQGDVLDSMDLMDLNWVAYGGCTRAETESGVTLQTTGIQDPSGIATQKIVEEGQIIYIRLAVKLLSGQGEAFSVGSHDINQGEGDMKKFKIPQNGSTIYLDKRLYCKHREPISINIDVHNLPDMLEPTKVEISHVEIKYLSENDVSVTPIDTSLKTRVNSLEDRIQNIINNI